MSALTSAVELHAVNALRFVSDSIQAFLDSPETDQPERLEDAANAINWLFGESSDRHKIPFSRVCRLTDTDQHAVRQLFIGSFRRYWTESARRLIAARIGIDRMQQVA